MIQDVDETLRQLLAAELKKAPGAAIQSAEQIVFRSPNALEGEQAQVNLFLHDVCENTLLRDEPFRYERSAAARAERKRSPVRLNLSYLVTAHARSSAEEHALLTEILGALLRFPTIPADNGPDAPDYRQGALKNEENGRLFLSVAQPDHLVHSGSAQMWQAIGGPLRPALGLTVTAAYDPFEARPVPVVTNVILGTGQGLPPDGPRRPLDLQRTWVSAAGVVVNEANKPLADVFLWIEGREETAQTDERGFFYFLNLPEGEHAVKMRRRGYKTDEIKIHAPPAGRMEQVTPQIALMELNPSERAADEAETALSALSLAPLEESERAVSVTLTGRLRYASGKPAAYIPVRVGRQQTSTDSEGVYHFYALPPGDHRVWADLAGQGEIEAPRAGNHEKEDKANRLLLPVEEAGEAAQRGREEVKPPASRAGKK